MIKKLISEINKNSACRVLPCTIIPPSVLGILPNDIKEFYSLCGGAVLFEYSTYPVRIVPPDEFVSANSVIIGEDIITNEIENYENEISKDWYIIADLYNSDYVVIDMYEERKGRCYKAFWDSYPDEGDTPIIALSFTELLMRLLENNGEYWFFLKDDFETYGDAYDL